jgi:hypothetical protein
MATADELPEVEDTLAELIEQLGGLPLHRIRMKSPPGKATEKDVLAALRGPRKRLCELVDGVLVEKPRGTTETLLRGDPVLPGFTLSLAELFASTAQRPKKRA